MAIKKLFNSSVQSENRTYLLIRDNSEYAKEKDFVEDGWIKLVKYLDPDFEKKIAGKFHEHFWELYLGLTLQKLDFELVPKEKQTKKEAGGSRFLCNSGR